MSLHKPYVPVTDIAALVEYLRQHDEELTYQDEVDRIFLAGSLRRVGAWLDSPYAENSFF